MNQAQTARDEAIQRANDAADETEHEKPETEPAKEKPRDSLFENGAGPIGYGKD